ncbi:MAG TPA: preprotein translocase subunit SecE [Verrucomicrobia bacterium]|nr:MAG: preprotein translocase subunit SecE [Lentisphaerae bacterium GWF2_57_35]HBA83538.1 preprotein translocase subunit SecE [Verrucomicrobiota bacterium]
MKKIKDAIAGLRTFIEEVRIELKKCTWPNRSELIDSTVVVIVSVVLVSLFVGVSDFVLSNLLRLVIH